jgi:hypothetical protein
MAFCRDNAVGRASVRAPPQKRRHNLALVILDYYSSHVQLIEMAAISPLGGNGCAAWMGRRKRQGLDRA